MGTAMALTIELPEADRLAHELASRLGVSVEEAILDALQHRVQNVPAAPQRPRPGAVMEISRRSAALPDYDLRSPEEILGYDENGVPR